MLISFGVFSSLVSARLNGRSLGCIQFPFRVNGFRADRMSRLIPDTHRIRVKTLKIHFLAAWWLLLSTWAYAQADASKLVRAGDYPHPVRIACVGDSITFGSQVEGRQTNSYPAVLGRL